MTNIFIANLDFEITSEDLRVTFAQFGEVHYAHVVFDSKTKKSKGFGYVEMPELDNAIAAIEALNGLEVNGRALDVKVASPKGSRPNKKLSKDQSNDKKPISKVNSENKQRTFNSNNTEKPKRVMRPRRKRL